MMNKANEPFSVDHVASMGLATDIQQTNSHLKIRIADKRVVRLLLVLQELDESVLGLEHLQMPELAELVDAAIQGCGFVDPVEAWYAVAAVLRVIEAPNSMLERA
jgi:hypothetical protein